jgi:hypothetical protein
VLGSGVQVARRLVEEQQVRLLEQLPGHEEALALPAVGEHAAVPQHGLATTGQNTNSI